MHFLVLFLQKKREIKNVKNWTSFNAAMSNSILLFATNDAIEFGHSPHYSQQVFKKLYLKFLILILTKFTKFICFYGQFY